MAEEDAEIALLHQLQAGQENGGWVDGGTKESAQGENSNTELNSDQVKRESNTDDQVLRTISPSGAGVYDDEDGDYDPSSISSIPAISVIEQDDSRSSSQASARKPKTVGGFIADDSDEEYEAALPTISCAGLQPSASHTLNHPIPPSPLQNHVSQQEFQAFSKNQSDSNTEKLPLPVNSSGAGNSPLNVTGTLTSTVSPAGLSIPKARLPNDRTGILEDRIKEDTRGDIDAWFALIKEHRNRNKLDEARAVYERFFKVFPQAVC